MFSFLLQNTTPTPVEGAVETAAEVSNTIGKTFSRFTDLFSDQLPNIIAGLLVVALFYLVARVAKAVFLFVSRKTEADQRLRVLVSRLLVAGVVLVGVFAALTMIVPNLGFGDLIAGLGFSSFIIGFATKDILNNFLSGMLVLWNEPFRPGDYVVVDKHEGEVVEIGIRATRLQMFDGEQILIPNGKMYSSALMIREAGALQRLKINVVIDYGSKVGVAKDLILEALEEQAGVASDPPPAVYMTSMAMEGIHLTSYFWVNTETDSLFQVTDSTSRAINHNLREAGIKLFPPKQLILENAVDESGEENQEDL